MKQRLLKRKFRTNYYYPKLEQDIEHSIDLGSCLSIGPVYTYYYSRRDGYQYLKNCQLSRIYFEIIVGRFGNTFLILELSNHQKIKFPGIASSLEIRKACDKFCPKVKLGSDDKEMDAEELLLYYQKRKKYILIFFSSILLWSLLFFYCIRFSSSASLVLISAASIAQVFLCIWLILWFKKR